MVDIFSRQALLTQQAFLKTSLPAIRREGSDYAKKAVLFNQIMLNHCADEKDR